MFVAGSTNGINRYLDIAVGAIFDADGHGQAGGQLAMNLALYRSGANSPPADQIGVELSEGGI